MGNLAAAGLLVLGCTWSTLCLSQPPDLSWLDEDQLSKGEILFNFAGDGNYRGRARAAVVIEAPLGRVLEILMDCESAPEFVPKIRSCVLIETLELQKTKIFRQQVKFSWFLPAIEHEFSLVNEHPGRIRVRKVSGPFEILDGDWWLLPTNDGGTTLIYELTFDPGLLLPRFVVGRTLRNDIPDTLRAIRSRSESDIR
jgi:ribosome-associated toxin RatA of RatAB toxin-antitoxin module